MDATEKVNILLVDDQPGKLLTYEAMLNELGENLIKASSGREALDHLLRTDIAVVLMDVSMPELDGFELAKLIRGHPRFQKTAIIFVSAVHQTDLDRLKGYESGAVHYVSVPVIPELLRAKVSVFVELYRKTRQLERLTRDLEVRVAERTAELQASVTRQIHLTEQLRQADRRKDEFLALLGHELRNPLAPLTNAVAIMRGNDSADPDLLWCADVIHRQVAQLSRLVDDLLDVARISQGKIALRVASVDLASIVRAAVEASRPVIDACRHELTVVMPGRPLMLMGDAARLTQVITNLLNNAARYQQKHGRIDVTVESDENLVMIRVRDNGIGIPPDILPHVFDLFVQGEPAPDTAQNGLGIGLSLVKNLVMMHGGTVHAYSEGSRLGSEFVVTLPLIADASAVAPASGDARPAKAPEGPRRKILVVDDNRDAAESVAMLLRLRGHEVTVAYEAESALEIAAVASPSVVLLDIGLPETDGYELCRRLRQNGMAHSRIIAMTGYGQERDRVLSREAGFDAHTVKPVVIEDLVKLLA